MSTSDKSNQPLRDIGEYVRDPELSLDASVEQRLSEADRETARRQRFLDERLRSAFGELGRRADQATARLDDGFMVRLKNEINAVDAAARKSGESYVAGLKRRLFGEYLREKLWFSESRTMHWAGAAAVFVFVMMPFALYYGGNGSSGSVAMSDEAVNGDGIATTSAPPIAAEESKPEQPSTEGAADREEKRVATAPPFPGASDIAEESESAPTMDDDVMVASRETQGMALDEPGAADAESMRKAAAPAPATIQERLLKQRLAAAESDEEKLLILRNLKSLYETNNRKDDAAETQRQIDALKK